jgi:catechol 2,3-dioxygenase-like lactoylglutathione lyase family enzyme
MKIESVNHIALMVTDAAASAEFYRRFCGMETVHSRNDGDVHVRWVRHPNQPDGFMLVLIESIAEISEDTGRMDHLGIYVEARKDVDEIAALAKKEGNLIEGPVYAGEIVGYYCMVRDPDGNLVEFSCEQARV